VLLGNWNGGVRGYGRSRAAGARLAVLRIEERRGFGGLGSVLGLGGAAFTDIGKLWADDVPFGRTTSLRPSIGAALLAAVPRRSQAHYRLDVVAPLAPDRDATSWTLRLSRVVPYQAFLRETADLARARSARPASLLIASP
jgi:hemolysin activation/secretion protein